VADDKTTGGFDALLTEAFRVLARGAPDATADRRDRRLRALERVAAAAVASSARISFPALPRYLCRSDTRAATASISASMASITSSACVVMVSRASDQALSSSAT